MFPTHDPYSSPQSNIEVEPAAILPSAKPIFLWGAIFGIPFFVFGCFGVFEEFHNFHKSTNSSLTLGFLLGLGFISVPISIIWAGLQLRKSIHATWSKILPILLVSPAPCALFFSTGTAISQVIKLHRQIYAPKLLIITTVLLAFTYIVITALYLPILFLSTLFIRWRLQKSIQHPISQYRA